VLGRPAAPGRRRQQGRHDRQGKPLPHALPCGACSRLAHPDRLLGATL